MKRINMNSKKGFTLVEIMCTIAIVITLLSVTVVGVTDHLNNAKTAATIVSLNYKKLDQIDGEAFGDPEGHSASAVTIDDSSTPAVADTANSGNKISTGSQVDKTMSGGLANNLSDAAQTPAQAETPAEQNPATPREEAINACAESISNYASAHNVDYLPGTENFPQLLAQGEIDAKALYDAGGYTGARYFTYYPATGTVTLANGDGKWMECKDGQNMIKASLDEAGAAATPGCNVRTIMDADYLSNPNKAIYIGINKTADGTYQIVPNICIDVNGNFNTVITHRFDSGTGWKSSRDTFDAANLIGDNGKKTANFNAYVNYVTNRSGEMIDTTGFDMSQFNTRRSTAAQNKVWQDYVQGLRTSY